MKLDKISFLWDIVEKQIGNIIPSENYYKESIDRLNNYEYICNCCLEMFDKYNNLYKSRYRSEKEVGEKAHKFLIELKEWIEDVLKEED